MAGNTKHYVLILVSAVLLCVAWFSWTQLAPSPSSSFPSPSPSSSPSSCPPPAETISDAVPPPPPPPETISDSPPPPPPPATISDSPPPAAEAISDAPPAPPRSSSPSTSAPVQLGAQNPVLSLEALPTVEQAYQLLGLKPDASLAAVRAATLERLRRHRDGAHRGHAEETARFTEANLAFEALLRGGRLPQEESAGAGVRHVPTFVLWSGWQLDWWPPHLPCALPCHFTADRSHWEQADYLVLLGPVVPDDRHALPEHKPPHQRWVLYTAESYVNTPALQRTHLMRHIDLVVSTDRRRSHVTARYCPEPHFFEQIATAPLPRKDDATAPLVWFASNCDQSPQAPLRTAFVRELMQHIEVHSYGGCLHNRELSAEARAQGDRDSQVVHTARNYRFYLALENSEERGYVSEKVFLGLRAHAIPVYAGAPDIEEHLPYPDMVIRADRFRSPAELAAYLRRLENDPAEYARYFRYRQLYAEGVPMRPNLRTNCSQPFCQLCREALRELLDQVE